MMFIDCIAFKDANLKKICIIWEHNSGIFCPSLKQNMEKQETLAIKLHRKVHYLDNIAK